MASSNNPTGDTAEKPSAASQQVVGEARRRRAAMLAAEEGRAESERKKSPSDMPDLSSNAARPAAPAANARRRPPLSVKTQGAHGPLRAAVQIREIDPWSALKLSGIVSIALFFVWMVAVGTLYLVLEGMNVWERLNNTFTDLLEDSAGGQIIGPGEIFAFAGGIGLVSMILFTALCTLGSFIYNLSADLVGGVEVTLADRD
jgi:hypothetical protein